MQIKTRFAPSPTGHLHIGSARTALYSWLFARSLNGKFVLRIEDTDLERSTKKAIKIIIDSMNWLNLYWDEGPYFQTKRFDRYNTVIDSMLSKGTAYRCFCSKERLELLRKTQIANGKKPRYDGKCRDIDKYEENNKPCVIRFRNPQHGSVVFTDLIRGPITFYNQELDDLIIRRTDKSPTYNFCVVVDDFDMSITHVIRGEDHINNTPRQINILKALGAPIPKYAHVSMIIGNDGKKLSKRHGAIGVMQYRDEGFLPEALLNYLVRLGWSHGNKEIFNLDEMKHLFNLDKLSKSPSVFNINKLLWLNKYYINALPSEYVSMHLLRHIEQQNIDINHGPKLSMLIKLLGKRYKTLKEIASNCRYLYEDNFDKYYFNDTYKKYINSVSIPTLELIYANFSSLNEWTPNLINKTIKQTAESLKITMNSICMPLRVAITGTDQSPTLDVTLYAIGQQRCLDRIINALNFIKYKK